MYRKRSEAEKYKKVTRSYYRSLIREDILNIVVGIFTIPFGIFSIYEGIKGLCEHKRKDWYQ